MEAYLIDGIDKGLGIAPLETPNHLCRLPARAYCLDKRNSFTLMSDAADQPLQGSFTRKECGTWSFRCWGVVFSGLSTIYLM